MNQFFRKLLYGGGVAFDIGKWIIFAGILLTLSHIFWMTIFVVDGVSMEPTFKDKELVLLNKSYYRSHDPKRGEVVVVRYPGDPAKKKYVKRVIGLPGETISIAGGKVFINGKAVTETYLAYNVSTEPNGNWKLNTTEYFLMGDNRPLSNDCRFFGPVEKRFFIGKTGAIIYPRLRTDFDS